MDYQPNNNFPPKKHFIRYIIEIHHKKLLVFAVGISKSYNLGPATADDAMQDTYVKVIENLDWVYEQYKQRGRLGYTYLCGIVLNCIREKGRQKRQTANREASYAQSRPTTVDIHTLSFDVHLERTIDFLRAVLSEENATIMALHLLGYNYEEIGKEVNLSKSAVGARISRIKAKLRDNYGDK